MRKKQRLFALLCAVIIFAGCLALPSAAEGEGKSVTVLFTHDLHSHFLPQATGDGESGGYARLMTALGRERASHPDALTLDGGDFSIGSLIQTLYTTRAAELVTMGAMGYDAVTLGNHEFDHKGSGFAEMLDAAVSSGQPVPAILEANYAPDPSLPEGKAILNAMERYGVRDCTVIERGGAKIGIFGLMGADSHDCAPTSGFLLSDAVEAAKRCVGILKDKGADFIVCLSHSGTSDDADYDEDTALARAVDGIDLIVSGHSHAKYDTPPLVNGTYIASSGPYCQNLGSVTLSRAADGTLALVDYHLVPIDETLEEDPEISALVEQWKDEVSRTYLSRYGLEYDEELTHSDFPLPTPDYGYQAPNGLGELIADAYFWAAETLGTEKSDRDAIALTADGVIRMPLGAGAITVSQAFDVLSMGVGEDGTSGFPLVSVYLTGRELRAVAEVDASVTPIMPAAQLYISGLSYSINPHRMFFNRATDIYLKEPYFASATGGLAAIDDSALYRVVTGMYSAQMLGTVKKKSMGLLSLEPKLADGSPVTDFSECIIRDADGNEVKEWYALAAYLRSFGDGGVPEHYAEGHGKTVSRSRSPVELLRSPNWITLTVLAVAALLIVLAVLLVRAIVHRARRRRAAK